MFELHLTRQKSTKERHNCKKTFSGIGVLRRIKPFVPQGSLVTLFKALIQSYFDYCSPLWDTCDKTLKDKLQMLQNRAARVILLQELDMMIGLDLLQSLGGILYTLGGQS